jgi:hypothetical protein
MAQMSDLRKVIPPREPLRCSLSDTDIYEVRFEVLPERGKAGNITRMLVLRSFDGGRTWRQLRLRRDWRQWWAIVNGGLGGSAWPPAGEDVKDAFVKDGRFTISYCNLYEHGPKGQLYVWEMQHDTTKDQWKLALLEEVA